MNSSTSVSTFPSLSCALCLSPPSTLSPLCGLYPGHELVHTHPKLAISWYTVACYYWTSRKFEFAQKYLHKATKIDKRYPSHALLFPPLLIHSPPSAGSPMRGCCWVMCWQLKRRVNMPSQPTAPLVGCFLATMSLRSSWRKNLYVTSSLSSSLSHLVALRSAPTTILWRCMSSQRLWSCAPMTQPS
jgi:hypothetical protein